MRYQYTCALAAITLIPALATAANVVVGTGPSAADVATPRDAFRVILGGGVVAGPNGSFTDGSGSRREINWDGVPAGSSAPNNLPAAFFNTTSPRGAVLSGAASFQVSAATTDSGAGQPAAPNFGNINPSYPTSFSTFSAQRLFTSTDSNEYDVTFFLPGTATPALTKGFGAVFSDVDLFNTTSIEYFDSSNSSLGKFFAPGTLGNATFSFLGVAFDSPVVGRVHIVQGTSALGANVFDAPTQTLAAPVDLVVADDFLYAEPTIPEPASLSILALGGLVLLRRRGRQTPII